MSSIPLPAFAEASAVVKPSLVVGDRYRIARVVKHGVNMDTCFGTDMRTGARVVIKTASIRGMATGAATRLRHEANVLQHVGSDSFSRVLDFGEQDGRLYLVLSYVPGVTLQEFFRQRALDLEETVCVAIALLEVLCKAHGLGILHRDIKPANVIVNDGSRVQWATLIDFGFARSLQLDAAIRNEFVGTARYMAPEQAGLLDRGVCEASDLYSVGIVLFEALSGHPPFSGKTVGEVLRQHITERVPDLCGLGIRVPRVVDEVIQRLVRKDPGDRYQTAAGALNDLKLVAKSLERGDNAPTFVVGLQDSRDTLTEPSFVGRNEELHRLDSHASSARQGQGGLVLVEAESGVGKTRLLDEFAQRVSRKAVFVVRGNLFDRAAPKPLQALEGICSDVIAASSIYPELLKRIRRCLRDKQEIVSDLLPDLAGVLGFETKSQLGPEDWGETRALNALTVFLDSLGTPEQPAFVIFDDCQWADELSLKLIANWCHSNGGPSRRRAHVLMLAAFRSEEIGPYHSLRRLRAPDCIKLLPFGRQDTRKLAASMAGVLPEEVLQLLERLSEGTPFMISAVLRGLVESGALLPDDSGWCVEPAALQDVQSSRHAAAFLARRINLFPPRTVDFLTVGAVLGKEFRWNLAAGLAGQTPAEATTAVKEARQRHVLWSRADGMNCVFVHDRLREALIARIAESEIRAIHCRAATQLEQDDPAACFDLAYHFDAAGESEKALPYALQAAEQARAQHSLAIAAEQYRIAQRGVATSDASTRYAIAEGLGDVFTLQGDYDHAADMFQAAATLGKKPVQKAEIEGRMGELAFKKGDMKTAGACIERALCLLGERVPKGRLSPLLLLMWEAFVQGLHSVFPRVFLARLNREGADTEFISIRLLRRLSYAYWFSQGTTTTLWAHLRGMNMAERYPDTLELAHAYANHGPGMSTIPWFRRGHKYAEKSLQIRKKLNDIWGQAHSLSFHGVVLHAQSRFSECIDKCREAIRLFEQTGDYWEMTTARYEVALSLYRLGDLQRAVKEARRMRQIGLEHGDEQASGMSLDVWVRASCGQVPAEVFQSEVDRKRNDPQTTSQVLLAEGVRLLYAADLERAVSVLEQACDVATRAGIRHAWVAAIWPWLATARRQQAENTRDRSPASKRKRLKLAKRAARRAVWMARSFQNELPHALRESALVAAMQGRAHAARRMFDRSLSVARRQKARYEQAQTLLARGEIGQELGWPAARDDLDLAAQILGETQETDDDSVRDDVAVPKPTTLSLIDRFDTVLEAGREIASALSRDDIYAATRDATARLLRGENCLVLELARVGEVESSSVVAGNTGAIVSRDVVRRTFDTHRPVVLANNMSADASESVVLSGARSTLCAPIFVRQEIASFVYVTHGEVVGLFGEDEKRLAEFIATIAGAALENAQGFHDLQQLNATLEQRVAERTADLEQRTTELAKSNQELEQFAYVASHDLQEPLRTVASYCQLLQRRYRGKLDKNADDFLQTAVDGAARMRALINDLLAYSRVGTRGEPFGLTDFSTVLSRALTNLRIAIEESGAAITHDDLPAVEADASQMTQLLQNLIGNAIKFRGKNTPRIHVSAARQHEGWLFSVQDNGIGIAQKHLDRIFKIFQRLHSREVYAGTGIGLAICQKTVMRHGGRIWVTSEPGKGSTFFFTLPTCQSESADTPNPS